MGVSWLKRFLQPADFKSNFLNLKQLVLIGGPDDGVITPWQSRHVSLLMLHVLGRKENYVCQAYICMRISNTRSGRDTASAEAFRPLLCTWGFGTDFLSLV